MRSRKSLSVLLFLVAALLCLSSCQESNESRYDKAKELAAKGQYAEAAEKFTELADFEKSGMYVTYCNALIAGESGDFEKAAEQLAGLAGFEESASYKAYYETRIAENGISGSADDAWTELLKVADAYTSLGTFRDSALRAENCRKIIYDAAAGNAADLDYDSAITKLEKLADYRDSASLIKHYNDVRTYEYDVTGFRWERTVQIEENIAYPESGWELPENAELTDQREEIHHYESAVNHYEPAAVTMSRREIDHYESYPVFSDVSGEIVVKQPVYAYRSYVDTIAAPVFEQIPVYQTKYYYNVRRWSQTRMAESGAEDHRAAWPDAGLSEYEREGEKTGTYSFTVKRDDRERTLLVDEDTWNGIEEDGKVYLTVVHSAAEEYLSTKEGEKIADIREAE